MLLAQHQWVWSIPEISFEMVDSMTDDPVVTVVVTTPAGQLTFMAELVGRGTTLVARSAYVQDARPNAVGAANLMVIAQALMEGMGFDGLEVEGAVRTTGANPGHRPSAFRFTRRFRAPVDARRAGPKDH